MGSFLRSEVDRCLESPLLAMEDRPKGLKGQNYGRLEGVMIQEPVTNLIRGWCRATLARAVVVEEGVQDHSAGYGSLLI